MTARATRKAYGNGARVRESLPVWLEIYELDRQAISRTTDLFRDCRICGRSILNKHLVKHAGSRVCTAFVEMSQEGRGGRQACSRRSEDLLVRNGIKFKPGLALTRKLAVVRVLYVPEMVAIVCRTLRGRVLEWALAMLSDDHEFCEAIASVHRIEPCDDAIVEFVLGQYENRPGARKRHMLKDD